MLAENPVMRRSPLNSASVRARVRPALASNTPARVSPKVGIAGLPFGAMTSCTAVPFGDRG